MFTGIVQGLGKVAEIKGSAKEFCIKICPFFEINDYIKGESIAINGVCLTVETFGKDFFSVYASSETLSKTNLGRIKINSKVNLERAMKLNDRLGGHLVTGHIDGLVKVKSILKEGSSIRIAFEMPEKMLPYVVNKGSVCLDGISLTVNKCYEQSFDVNIIPETQSSTIMKDWQIGDDVNIETDIIGKYIYKNMQKDLTVKKDTINEAFLKQNGFM